MPEGPEVTVIREGLNSLLKGYQIYSLEILSFPYILILEDI